MCWTDLRNAVSEKTIFNNEQVTCVGARVVGKTIIERATMPDLDLLIIVIKARFSYSAKAIPMTERSFGFGLESKNFKLKSLILAQIERWRHA